MQKVSLVVRREGGKLRTYTHLGTGNYHPITAKIYTDLSYFTCNPSLSRDAAHMFNLITSYAQPTEDMNIAIAPYTLRERLLEHIKAEIKACKSGKASQYLV